MSPTVGAGSRRDEPDKGLLFAERTPIFPAAASSTRPATRTATLVDAGRIPLAAIDPIGVGIMPVLFSLPVDVCVPAFVRLPVLSYV